MGNILRIKTNFIRMLITLLLIILAIVLIDNLNDTEQIINAIESSLGINYEIKKEDIIEIVKREKETLVFHKGINRYREGPIYVLSYVEKNRNGKGWHYSGGYSYIRVIDDMNEYFSTMTCVGAGDDDNRMVTGVVKGKNVESVIVKNTSEDISSMNANIKKISDDITLWYVFVDKNDAYSYTAIFKDKDGQKLHEESLNVKNNPIEVIEDKRGYDIPEEDVIDIIETDFGLLVFYKRYTARYDKPSFLNAFEIIKKGEEGYMWITGGQHSDEKLDNLENNVSSLMFVEHITKEIQQGFVYGVMRSKKVNQINISKGLHLSNQLIKANTIILDDSLVLWYAFLPEDFGNICEVGFLNKDSLLFSVKSIDAD